MYIYLTFNPNTFFNNMDYDTAINLIWDAGFEDVLSHEEFLQYISSLDPDLDITSTWDDVNKFLIIKIKIRGGYAKVILKSVPYNSLIWYDDDFISLSRPVNFARRMIGQGMYNTPVFPHFPPGKYYRDKVGQLKDDEGYTLKEMDGIAFDHDANMIGYDPKVYPFAPTSEQIEQAKINIFTDEMMNAHQIIHNYVPIQPMKHIRTKRKIDQIGSRRPASEWEIDEYLRNYKGPGS